MFKIKTKNEGLSEKKFKNVIYNLINLFILQNDSSENSKLL